MANTSSAKKRVRQSLKHRERNMSLKNRMRTAVKKVIKATEEKNPGQANEPVSYTHLTLPTIYSV